MQATPRTASACAAAAVAVFCASDALAQGRPKAAADADAPWHNVTAGGPLRPGVYGRIELQGEETPPLIFREPVIGSGALVPTQPQPVYLYVPPGQVRRWSEHCAKWSACDRPVYFVRVDKSPSRWGAWRHLRDDVALQGGQRPE